MDDFQYENNLLQFIPTAEGYYDFIKKSYIYNVVDHLGNVRLSYWKNGGGVLEILEENNYYPFGLKHEGYNNVMASNPAYQYKYNGKELQETGMYDYGARFYMPDINRTLQIDPLAEKMSDWSPYSYAFNNPIRNTDPTGMEPEDTIETGCCPDPPSKGSSLPADPIEFAEMIGGAINSLRASVSNLVVRGYNTITGDKVRNKYEVDTDGTLTMVTGVPKETGKEKIKNTIGDLITIGISVAGGPEGMLMSQGGKAPVLKGVQDIKNQALDIKNTLNKGKNSVTVKSSNGQTRFDLDGKAHNGVLTPHKQTYKNNVVNGEVKSVTRTSKNAISMTQQEIRTVKKVLKNRNEQ